ncbi:hypothetical protein [Sphingomonas lenta]|uniref:Uncharacterized protein n=1 Tax=Sphingomonas lenta TaxID=1141887 RepID=A0A2A2SB22_9SPHN|nr:hypothetical protein [Sphingomonas lenta]PAX06380.1 hypothetical protein CKY28_17410 [Sphingomonas lenta]
MSICSFLADLFDRWGAHGSVDVDPSPGVNPATGLPMMDGAVDVAGNPFGTSRQRHDDPYGAGTGSAGLDHHHHSGSSINNDWSSSSWSGVSNSWPDYSSSSSSSPSDGYDPSRGW